MLDYELIEKQQLQSNILKLRRKIDQGRIPEDVMLKVRNFSEKFNIDRDFLVDRLLRDDLLILNFMKEPQKQTLHETKAFEYLCSFEQIMEPKNLPSGGDNALYVHGGQVIKGSELTSRSRGKSIDFYWKMKVGGKIVDCYATHKYTKTNGGAQDNQFKDVTKFFADAAEYRGGDKFFFAILDGPYYQMPYHGSKSKIEYLNATYQTQSNRILATTINDLKDTVFS